MSSIYHEHQDRICPLPFMGLTVTPTGGVSLCCSSLKQKVGQLSEISDLEEFYNGSEFNKIRMTMECGEISSIKHCAGCFSRFKDGVLNHAFVASQLQKPHFDHDWLSRKKGHPTPIRFLEYTSSSLCNQTCSTCSSLYSSSWSQAEKNFSPGTAQEFNRPLHPRFQLDPSDINKILKVVPDLDLVTLKGGEPWLDPNNIRILSHILQTNPYCQINIISNMAHLGPQAIKVVKQLRDHRGKVNVTASIDGVHHLYNWIRGSAFEQTIQTIEKFFEYSGKKISVFPCISIHNFFSLEDIIQFFLDKEYVGNLELRNIARDPTYVSIHSLPIEVFAQNLIRLQQTLPPYQQLYLERGKSLKLPFLKWTQDIAYANPSPQTLQHASAWTRVINQMRGFDIQNIVPALARLLK